MSCQPPVLLCHLLSLPMPAEGSHIPSHHLLQSRQDLLSKPHHHSGPLALLPCPMGMADIVEGKHGVLRFSWKVHGHNNWDTVTHSAQSWWHPFVSIRLSSASLVPGVSPLTFLIGALIPGGCSASKSHVGHQMFVQFQILLRVRV